MKITVAAICDFAQVREGLLSISSAGINRVGRPRYPAPMGVMLAFMLEVAPSEAVIPREIELRVEDADGARGAEVSLVFQIPDAPPALDPGELMMLPFVFDFRMLQLPAAGRYQIVVDLMTDGVEPTVLSFRAV